MMIIGDWSEYLVFICHPLSLTAKRSVPRLSARATPKKRTKADDSDGGDYMEDSGDDVSPGRKPARAPRGKKAPKYSEFIN